MRKLVMTAGVIVGLAVLAKRLAAKVESVDWERALAAMPDNAPPKWMFTNITAIRRNTDAILELLEKRQTAEGEAIAGRSQRAEARQ